MLAVLTLSVGLAMDATAVAAAKGFGAARLRVWDAAKMALLFGVFQAGMPIVGWAIGDRFAKTIEAWDHWIAFALLGGILAIPVRDNTTRAFGYLEARPSIVDHRTVTLDGYIGNALTADGSQILYGGGATINFAPSWPICPFLGIGGGGLMVRPNADSFVLQREDLYMARAGGGILMALRGRILVRLEASNLALFDSERLKNAQTYSGGFGVYF